VSTDGVVAVTVMAPPASVMSMKKENVDTADQPVPESVARPSTRMRLPTTRASRLVRCPRRPARGRCG